VLFCEIWNRTSIVNDVTRPQAQGEEGRLDIEMDTSLCSGLSSPVSSGVLWGCCCGWLPGCYGAVVVVVGCWGVMGRSLLEVAGGAVPHDSRGVYKVSGGVVVVSCRGRVLCCTVLWCPLEGAGGGVPYDGRGIVVVCCRPGMCAVLWRPLEAAGGGVPHDWGRMVYQGCCGCVLYGTCAVLCCAVAPPRGRWWCSS